MGLFDNIADQVAGALSGQTSTGGQDLMGLVGNLINNPQMGGLQGWIQAFHDKGLGGIVSSWVGTGDNLPISAEQLASVLDSHTLQDMAQQAGLPVQGLTEQLAGLLPQVIDKITPNGSVPQEEMLSQGLGMLGGLFK